MGACYCTGKCRELGYCPNTVAPVGPDTSGRWWPKPATPPTVTPFPAPQGWVCPKCGNSNAPWAYTCMNCAPGHFTITLSNNTSSTDGVGWPD